MPKLIPKITKQKAINLRQQGYSLDEIAHKLSFSKSTVRYWIHNLVLNSKAIQTIQEKRKRIGFQNGNSAWKHKAIFASSQYCNWTEERIHQLQTQYYSGLSV